MSGLAGWINFETSVSSPDLIDRMAGRLARFDGSAVNVVRGSRCAITRAALGDTPAIYHTDGEIAVILGQVRFSDPVLARRARDEGAAKALVSGFRERGPAILESLQGAFALALILEKERRALLAVDRVSTRPLMYARVNGSLVFGSDAAAINAHPGVSREIDPQQIFNYLYFHMVPGPGSVYKHHVRLNPGGYVYLTTNTLETGSYWKVEYTRESEHLSVAGLKDEFRDLIRTSVRQELDGARIGAFLSGGTDSSTVSGVIGEITGEPARTYSIGFGAQGYDETRYARIASRHFGTQHHEYYVTPQDVAAAIPKLADIYAEPFGNSSAVPTYYCARMAKADGVTKLLAGDGGDELFGGNARYATQYLFSLYSDLPPGMRQRFIEPIAFAIPWGERLLPVRKLRSYIRQASLSMPARLETYNLLERLGTENVLTPEFLRAVDTARPLTMLTEVYAQAHAATMLNRMLAMDLKFTLADNDLPKVSKTAELAGVDVGYPLLNDELIAFAARLPVKLKLRGTKLRYFFKQALRDFLPREVITKTKHGFGLPIGPWLQHDRALREIACDSLSDIKRRGIVRPEFVDDLLGTHLPSHPGFYGTMVWLLIMLEQWHKYHVDSAERS